MCSLTWKLSKSYRLGVFITQSPDLSLPQKPGGGGAESFNPLITRYVLLVTSPHPEAISEAPQPRESYY